MPDSQSREPEVESPLLPFQSLGIFVLSTTPRFTQLYKLMSTRLLTVVEMLVNGLRA